MEERNNNPKSPYISELDELLKQAQQSIQDFYSKCCRRLNNADREYRQLSSDYNTLEQQTEGLKSRLGANELLERISGQLACLYNAVVALPDGEDKKHLIDCINGLNAYFSNCGVAVKYHPPGSTISKTDKSVAVAGARETGDKNLDGLVCESVKVGFDIPGESPIEEQVIVYSYDKALHKLSASSRLDMTLPITNAAKQAQKEYLFKEYVDFVCIDETPACKYKLIILLSERLIKFCSCMGLWTMQDLGGNYIVTMRLDTIHASPSGQRINYNNDCIRFEYYIPRITDSNELVLDLHDFFKRPIKTIILSKIDKK